MGFTPSWGDAASSVVTVGPSSLPDTVLIEAAAPSAYPKALPTRGPPPWRTTRKFPGGFKALQALVREWVKQVLTKV